MKKPPSVITTLVLFAFIIFIGILTAIKNSPSEALLIASALLMPSLFSIGWVGVFLRKNWAKIYSSVLIFLFGILMLALPFINKVQPSDRNEQIIFMLIMFCFFSWWAYSLGIGKASKEYFLEQKHT